MSIVVGCMKCGKGIEVDDETLSMFKSQGQPVSASHEVCPEDEEDQNEYRFVVTVYKNGERIAQVGDTLKGQTFDDVFPSLTKSINTQWERVGERSALADMDPE